MSHTDLPQELRYAKTHEWLKLAPDGTATVGITGHAQDALGDITFVQLPKAGTVLKAGEVFGVVESVKSASDLYVPVGGTVLAVNTALELSPELVNRDPYGEGWMIRLSVADRDEAAALVEAAAYAQSLA